MSRHVSEITIEELESSSRAAADEAIADSLAKGVPVTGHMLDGDGNVWLARRHPGGEIEWLELVRPAPRSSSSFPVRRRSAGDGGGPTG